MRTIVCCDLKCGIEFSVPEHVWSQARWYPARWIYCPNGHQQHYSKSEKEQMEEQVKRLQSNVDDLEARLLTQVRLVAYWKGQAHRKKKP